VSAFTPFDLTHGALAEHGDTRVAAWSGRALHLAGDGTHFGFVHRGPATIHCAAGRFTLRAGMYFAVPGELSVDGGGGLLVTHPSTGLMQIGGPLEPTGRLRYIDGCTDTLLVAPPTRGDPCLSALYFPPHTRQTAHTHPSLRVGIVAAGEGACLLPGARLPLRPGLAFVIAADAEHSFATEGAPLIVVAYHPDSDHGPTHADHPMINRTFIDGVSAARRGAP
jgi:quercetin dioxygenase-like cupin family protein